MTRPLREVTRATLKTGRGSVLGPDTDRRARWWNLGLACGHVVERDVKYRRHPRGRQRARSNTDVLPAPQRARCDTCPQETP